MNKVTVPRKVADAIYHLRSEGFENRDILKVLEDGAIYEDNIFHVGNLQDYSQDNYDSLLYSLLIGYEVENSPEESLRKYFDEVQGQGEFGYITREAIENTLDILGIKVEGINYYE